MLYYITKLHVPISNRENRILFRKIQKLIHNKLKILINNNFIFIINFLKFLQRKKMMTNILLDGTRKMHTLITGERIKKQLQWKVNVIESVMVKARSLMPRASQGQASTPCWGITAPGALHSQCKFREIRSSGSSLVASPVLIHHTG